MRLSKDTARTWLPLAGDHAINISIGMLADDQIESLKDALAKAQSWEEVIKLQAQIRVWQEMKALRAYCEQELTRDG